MDMDELIPGKEYLFVPNTDAHQSAFLHGATAVFERQGTLFPAMAMVRIHGRGMAVYPDELVDPEVP